MLTRWTIGLTFLGVVVVLWVASGFFVNAIASDYPKPYLITYVNTGLMVLYLPVGLRQEHRKPGEMPTKFSRRETAKLSLQFGLLWFLSNLLNNASYAYTTVQSATILSCTSSLFTLIIGAWFGVERFYAAKLIPLLVSVLGVSLISYQDDKEVTAPPQALLGNLFALGSALLYGVYTTMLKYRVGSETNLNTKLFIGFVGLLNIVGFWPLLLLVNWCGFEPFQIPPSSKVWVLLGLNGLAILVSDFCWVLAMLMTSPLVVTVGLSATIPLSILGEMVLNGRVGSIAYFLGAGLVAWGFLVVNREEENEEDIIHQDHEEEALAH